MTKKIQQLVAEKHSHFNDYKVTESAESFVSFKKYRNLVNRKLKEAQNHISEDFLRNMKLRNRNGNSLRKKIGKKKNSPNITEIDENGEKMKDKNKYVTF